MSYESQVMQHHLKQIIKNLKNSGLDDITTEDVTLTNNKKGTKLKVRFYKEEQWIANPAFKATTAQVVMKQAYKGSKLPDHVVKYKNTNGEVETFFVKVL